MLVTRLRGATTAAASVLVRLTFPGHGLAPSVSSFEGGRTDRAHRDLECARPCSQVALNPLEIITAPFSSSLHHFLFCPRGSLSSLVCLPMAERARPHNIPIPMFLARPGCPQGRCYPSMLLFVGTHICPPPWLAVPAAALNGRGCPGSLARTV